MTGLGLKKAGGSAGIPARQTLIPWVEVGGELSYPSHFDPPLHHLGPLLWLQGPVPETGGDDTVGHAVELRDRGADGGGQVLFALLVPLGPDAAQAVVRHHFLEQLLQDKGREKGLCEFSGERTGQEEKGMGRARPVPRAPLTQLVGDYSQHPSV